VVDLILDKAGQKGTGQWTLLNAAENAVVISTINAAVEARVLSSQKTSAWPPAASCRARPAGWTSTPSAGAQVHDALYASQDHQLRPGPGPDAHHGREEGLGAGPGRIAGIWRGGCIIRARFLRASPRPTAPTPGCRT
jgi:6-phosphogluconate dehydrogenase